MKLKEMRKKRGLSGYDVAKVIKVSPQYYYELEREDKRCNTDILDKLADFYGVKVDELLGRGEPGPAMAPGFEEEWPEIVRVLRRSGHPPTERERKRIAKIIQLAIEDTEED